VREGIARILAAAEEIVVVAEGSNGVEALRLAENLNPDVILLDMEMPVLRGDEVVGLIRADYPETKILAVSSYNDSQYIQAMLENGASGYITKDEAPSLIVEAVRSIYDNHGHWMSPQALKSLYQSPGSGKTLTQREIDILYQLLQDKPAYEISHVLGLEIEQVDNHLRMLMVKFDVDSLSALKQVVRDILLR
jgi:DNA-binding NarL/FixJ family response regulator